MPKKRPDRLVAPNVAFRLPSSPKYWPRRRARVASLSAFMLMPAESVKAPPKPRTRWYFFLLSTLILISLASAAYKQFVGQNVAVARQPACGRRRRFVSLLLSPKSVVCFSRRAPPFDEVKIAASPTASAPTAAISSQNVALHTQTMSAIDEKLRAAHRSRASSLLLATVVET